MQEENRLLQRELSRLEDLLAHTRAERDELASKHHAVSERVSTEYWMLSGMVQSLLRGPVDLWGWAFHFGVLAQHALGVDGQPGGGKPNKRHGMISWQDQVLVAHNHGVRAVTASGTTWVHTRPHSYV